MTDAELLTKVKAALGITGTFQDETLEVYISDVKAFMQDAGVSADVVSSAASVGCIVRGVASVGCIVRGVADLWNYGSGNGRLSPYFTQRMLQLAAPTATATGGGSNGI